MTYPTWQDPTVPRGTSHLSKLLRIGTLFEKDGNFQSACKAAVDYLTESATLYVAPASQVSLFISPQRPSLTAPS